MRTHCMIFLTIGNLVSPSSSLNGNPLNDFPGHWHPRFLRPVSSLSGGTEGADLARPFNEEAWALDCYRRSDLVKGGVGNLIGLNSRSSLNHS